MTPVPKLHQVIQLLQHLVLELEAEEKQQPKKAVGAKMQRKAAGNNVEVDGKKWIGKLLVITWWDCYHGRVGYVKSKRGAQYWNIR